MAYTATEVETENIYKYLESLRKLGVNAFVLQWAKNENCNFLVFLKPKVYNSVKFDVQVESKSSYTERALKEDIELISNNKFRSLFKM